MHINLASAAPLRYTKKNTKDNSAKIPFSSGKNYYCLGLPSPLPQPCLPYVRLLLRRPVATPDFFFIARRSGSTIA